MPMDQYIGGIEHAVLHLLYARFWTKVMRDCGLVKFDEPFTRLFTQGMLLNDCYYREDDSGKRRWFYPNEVEISFDDNGRPAGARATEDGQPVMLGGIEKMSKSKNNVVEPRDIIARFGADTARAFVMFAGPPDMSAAWSDSAAEGVYRFLRRLWAFGHARREAVVSAGAATDAGALDTNALSAPHKDLRRELHLNLKQALFDYQRMQYNTVVSATMKMLNALEEARLGDDRAGRALLREGLRLLLGTLYPIAPHICDALWREFGFAASVGDLLDAPLPAVSDAALAQDEIELVAQVNGKLRGTIRVPAAADRAAIERAALADANVRKHIGDAPVKRVVVVPGKLVNVVI
jgi:leucyl-tRNA synthetase